MKTRVVHCQREKFDVYIGRGIVEVDGKKVENKWGNPYSHREGTLAKFKVNSRKEAIEMYEKYLLSNEKLMNDLHELRGKILGCWCTPKPCHGQILAKYADAVSLF